MSENNNNLTVFQTLGKVFGTNQAQPESIPVVPQEVKVELLTSAESADDAYRKALTYKQNAFVQADYINIVKNDQNQIITAQSYRQTAMLDYEEMELYPILSQALNVLAEEATTLGENGNMLNCYSDNKKIKNELENLFDNILDINTSLQYWCRNMCKYGDNFLFLNGKAGLGITGVRQLPAYEITIKEEIENDNVKLKYVWTEKNATYNSWQIAHFRQLSDNKLMPYGSSILNPVRITWRQLKMSEDAMMVYRAARASERRVFKINVGNADSADVPAIVQSAASKFKRSTLVGADGKVNYKFNPASIEQDIFIPVRDANSNSTVIDTLPGATNMGDIADIEYLRANLFAGLGIPKIFLSFSDDGSSDGGGKNLSNLDVRFARKINKIQQCLVAELRKIAIIHLHLLGYDEEDITNFKLTLTNPSTQSDMLKIEHWLQKIDLYSKLTTANETGIKPMSETRAKQQILGMSNDEILEDLQQQMVENAVGNEIKNASLVIKNSKLFNDLYKYYNAGLVSDATMNGENPMPAEGGPDMGASPDVGGETPEVAPPEGENLQEKFVNKNKKMNDSIIDLLEKLDLDLQSKNTKKLI